MIADVAVAVGVSVGVAVIVTVLGNGNIYGYGDGYRYGHDRGGAIPVRGVAKGEESSKPNARYVSVV